MIHYLFKPIQEPMVNKLIKFMEALQEKLFASLFPLSLLKCMILRLALTYGIVGSGSTVGPFIAGSGVRKR